MRRPFPLPGHHQRAWLFSTPMLTFPPSPSLPLLPQFVSPGYQFKVVESSIPPRPSSADAHHLPDDRLLSGPDDEGPPTAMGRTGYAGPSMDLLGTSTQMASKWATGRVWWWAGQDSHAGRVDAISI